jgi:hypothetical protein
MTRKSKFVTLGILGAVAALGVTCCCCVDWRDEEEKQQQGAGGGRGGRGFYGRRWFPVFLGGGGHHPTGVAHGPSGGTSRGGFGSSGSHGGGVGA